MGAALMDDTDAVAVRSEQEAVLVLNDDGVIRECDDDSGRVFNIAPAKLLRQHISRVLPQLSGISLMIGGQINPRLRFLSHIGHRFEVIGKNGRRFLSEIFLSEVFLADADEVRRHRLRMVIRPVHEDPCK